MRMQLTLFDLDHTLIPFDSTLRWLRFLVQEGALPVGCDEDYLQACRQYLAGGADVATMHRHALAPLAGRTMSEIDAWRARFAEAVLVPEPPVSARRLVDTHRNVGDICVLVTNTTDIVAQPFARALGLSELVCSRAERSGERLTGALDGEACHGSGKVRKVTQWLALRGLGWPDVGHSRLYSDSSSDLPLLCQVAEAIAVCPDAGLREFALREGWRIVEKLDQAVGGAPRMALPTGGGGEPPGV